MLSGSLGSDLKLWRLDSSSAVRTVTGSCAWAAIETGKPPETFAFLCIFSIRFHPQAPGCVILAVLHTLSTTHPN